MARTGRPPVGKLRHVRFSDADWTGLGSAAAAAGTDRSGLLRQLAAAYLDPARMAEQPAAIRRAAAAVRQARETAQDTAAAS